MLMNFYVLKVCKVKVFRINIGDRDVNLINPDHDFNQLSYFLITSEAIAVALWSLWGIITGIH